MNICSNFESTYFLLPTLRNASLILYKIFFKIFIYILEIVSGKAYGLVENLNNRVSAMFMDENELRYQKKAISNIKSATAYEAIFGISYCN